MTGVYQWGLSDPFEFFRPLPGFTDVMGDSLLEVGGLHDDYHLRYRVETLEEFLIGAHVMHDLVNAWRVINEGASSEAREWALFNRELRAEMARDAVDPWGRLYVLETEVDAFYAGSPLPPLERRHIPEWCLRIPQSELIKYVREAFEQAEEYDLPSERTRMATVTPPDDVIERVRGRGTCAIGERSRGHL